MNKTTIKKDVKTILEDVLGIKIKLIDIIPLETGSGSNYYLAEIGNIEVCLLNNNYTITLNKGGQEAIIVG